MPLLFIGYIFESTPFNAFHSVWVMSRLEKPASKNNCSHETYKNWHIHFSKCCFSGVPGFTSSDKYGSKALLHEQCKPQQVLMGCYKHLPLGRAPLTALDICCRMGCLQRESIHLYGFFHWLQKEPWWWAWSSLTLQWPSTGEVDPSPLDPEMFFSTAGAEYCSQYE